MEIIPDDFPAKSAFKLKDAVKIIEYRRKKETEKENDAEPKGATEDSDEIKPFKKNKKKF